MWWPPPPAYVSSQEPPSPLPAVRTVILRGCGVAKFQMLPRKERVGMLGFQPVHLAPRRTLFSSIPRFRFEGRPGTWEGVAVSNSMACSEDGRAQRVVRRRT